MALRRLCSELKNALRRIYRHLRAISSPSKKYKNSVDKRACDGCKPTNTGLCRGYCGLNVRFMVQIICIFGQAGCARMARAGSRRAPKHGARAATAQAPVGGYMSSLKALSKSAMTSLVTSSAWATNGICALGPVNTMLNSKRLPMRSSSAASV